MAHECEGCGEWCYCDMDDCPMPQPTNCRHTCPEWADEDSGYGYDEDEEADRERYEIENGIPSRDGDGNYRSGR